MRAQKSLAIVSGLALAALLTTSTVLLPTAVFATPNGPLATLTISPSAATAVSGSVVSFTVEGFDAFGDDLGDVTAASTISSNTSADVVSGYSIVLKGVGMHTITAADGVVASTSTITVTAVPVAALTLYGTQTRGIIYGDEVIFLYEGWDAQGDDLGDVTSAVTMSSDSSADSIVGGTEVSFGTPNGVHTITASDGTAILKTPILVSPGKLYSSVINLGPSVLQNGAAVFASGSTVTFGINGRNYHHYDLGPVVDAFPILSTNPLDVISGDTVTFAPGASRYFYLRYVIFWGSIFSNKYTIFVRSSDLIQPSATTVQPGGSVTIETSGLDSAGGSTGDETSGTRLTSSDPTDVVAGNVLTLLTPGVHTITVTDNFIPGYPLVSTTQILVTAPVPVVGAIATIVTTPSAVKAVCGSSLTFTTVALDASANVIGDQSSSTILTSDDSTDVIVGNTISFTNIGVHTITATDGLAVTTTQITITVGSAASAVTTPSAGTVASGNSVTFVTVTSDAHANVIGDQSSTTTLTSDNSTDVIMGNTITFSKAGIHAITATYGAIVTVTHILTTTGPLASAITTPSSSTVVSGNTLTFTTIGSDAAANVIGDVSATATLTSDNNTDVVSGSSVTFGAAGIHTIYATIGTTVTATTIMITPALLSVPVITADLPTSKMVVLGAPVTLTIAGTGAGTLSVVWSRSAKPTGGFVAIPNQTGMSYTFTPTGSYMYYQATITNTRGLVSTKTLSTIIVIRIASVATITTNPSGAPVASTGGSVILKAAATSTSNLAVEWQSSVDNANWAPVADSASASYVTTTSYTAPPTLSGTRYYRVVFTNMAGSKISTVSPVKATTKNHLVS